MNTKATCWLKIEPSFLYKGSSQSGWRIVGCTQTQPKSGYAIMLSLTIPLPKAIQVDVDRNDVVVQTNTDIAVQKVVQGLEGEEV